jgi:hypothetical protein
MTFFPRMDYTLTYVCLTALASLGFIGCVLIQPKAPPVCDTLYGSSGPTGVWFILFFVCLYVDVTRKRPEDPIEARLKAVEARLKARNM